MSQIKHNGKLGGTFSFLIGGLDVLLVIYLVGIPANQRYDMGQFFANYAQNPLVMNVAWILLAVTSIMGFAVVPAVDKFVRSANNEEWVQTASIFGIVGFAISATSFLTLLGTTPKLAEAYVAGDSATQAAIVAIGLPQLDPFNVLVLGAVGIWLLIVNVLAWRSRKFRKLHAMAGIGLAGFLWVAVLAAMIQSETLDMVAAGAGALLAPIWYLWMGVRLFRPSPG